MIERRKPLPVTRESIAAVNKEFGGVDVGGRMVAAGFWKIVESKESMQCLQNA
jgi:hypothetical protein